MSKVEDNRSGILVAGNWIVDEVKLIDKFPMEQSLVNILHEYTSNGGSAYNILLDLVRLKAPFPLEAIGLVGSDYNGNQIIDQCKREGIDVRQLQMTPNVPTSYTMVASVKDTGKRTFFHHRGANSLLDDAHFDFSISNARVFHLGYLLLLDKLDEVQPDGTTKAMQLLRQAKERGFVTSVDLVSEDSNRFKNIIPCSLPFVDFLFLNEYEASRVTDVDLTQLADVLAITEQSPRAFERLFEMGVREWVIIHHPDGVWAAHREGQHIFQPSLALPDDYVVGANGAGDALAAGVLFGIHEGWDMKTSLRLGVCAAAASLSNVTCSDGVKPYQECFDLIEIYGYRQEEMT